MNIKVQITKVVWTFSLSEKLSSFESGKSSDDYLKDVRSHQMIKKASNLIIGSFF